MGTLKWAVLTVKWAKQTRNKGKKGYSRALMDHFTSEMISETLKTPPVGP
jgi:hypothetical protein